jgi:putative endonuclease
MYFVYFLRSEIDNSVYVGSTGNLEKRLKEHNAGKTRSTKSKRPLNLIYYEEFEIEIEARQREKQFKKSWSEKERVLRNLTSKDQIPSLTTPLTAPSSIG